MDIISSSESHSVCQVALLLSMLDKVTKVDDGIGEPCDLTYSLCGIHIGTVSVVESTVGEDNLSRLVP